MSTEVQECKLCHGMIKTRLDWGNVKLTPSSGFAGVAEASLDVNVNRETIQATAAAKRSDFVWAIRVAKISKGVLDGEWSHATFAKGASFGLNHDEDQGGQLVDALAKEGFKEVGKVNIDKDTDHVFLVQQDLNGPSGP